MINQEPTNDKDIIPALVTICLFILEIQTQEALMYARRCRNSPELNMLLRKLHKADEDFRKEAIYILEMSKTTSWN